MTKDLDETLCELGPAYRATVSRLVGGAQISPRLRRRSGRAYGWLVAASLLACLCLGYGLLNRHATDEYAVCMQAASASESADAYRLAQAHDERSLREIVRTQNADGSWKNDFLTRQNAKALGASSSPEAVVARKKALRNLRLRGLL